MLSVAILHRKLINAAASIKRAGRAACLGVIDLKVHLYSASPMGSSRCSNQPAAAAATRYTNHSVLQQVTTVIAEIARAVGLR